MREGTGKGRVDRLHRKWEDVPGIVIADGRRDGNRARKAPRIHAFVWGGKVQPTPTLPYGRWKGAA